MLSLREFGGPFDAGIPSQAIWGQVEGVETSAWSLEQAVKHHERAAPQAGEDIVRYHERKLWSWDKEPGYNECDNPIASMSKTIRANGVLHQWHEDKLKAAAANAHAEGADATDTLPDAVLNRSNYTQIMSKVVNVSGSLETVDKYARDSEVSYQLELRYGKLLAA